MKKTTLFLYVNFALLCFTACVQRSSNSANQSQIKREDGDSVLIKALDSLKPAQLKDTVVNTLALKIRGATIDVNSYLAIRNLTSNEQAISPIEEKYRHILPFTNGEKKQSDLFIGLGKKANFLNGKEFKWPSEGPNAPAQNRVLYVYGGKDFSIREPTADHKADTCHLLLHGLDCSGFVRELFVLQGIRMDEEKADIMRTRDFLIKALKPYFGLDEFDVQDSQVNPVSTLLTGDIIYFTKKGDPSYAWHIGIVLTNMDGNETFFHSSGWENGCKHNSSVKGGVTDAKFDYLVNTGYVYHVMRISVP